MQRRLFVCEGDCNGPLLRTITDELLTAGEVHVEYTHRYRNLMLVGYRLLETGQHRLLIWDVVEGEEVADLVADEEVLFFEDHD
jgi:hypothetical protein